MDANGYFVRTHGRVTGPFPLEELRRRARLGTVTRVHQVSRDQASWVAARAMPELFPDAPPAPGEGEEVPQEPASAPAQSVASIADDGAARESERAPASLALSVGLSSGVVVLFCMAVPHARRGEDIAWWWDFASEPRGFGLVVGCVAAVLAGVALIAIASIARGARRGWALGAASIVGTLGLFVAATAAAPGGQPFFASALLPIAGAALTSASAFRARAPGDPLARRWQVVAGWEMLLASAIVAMAAIALRGFARDDLQGASTDALGGIAGLALRGGGGSVGVGAVAAALAAIGVGAGFAAGARAALGSTASAADARFHARTSVLALVSISATSLAALVFAYDAAVLAPEPAAAGRFAFVQALRLVIMVNFFAAALAVGLWEMLAARSAEAIDPLEARCPPETT